MSNRSNSPDFIVRCIGVGEAAFAGIADALPVEVTIQPASAEDLPFAQELYEDLVRELESMGRPSTLSATGEGWNRVVVVMVRNGADGAATAFIRQSLDDMDRLDKEARPVGRVVVLPALKEGEYVGDLAKIDPRLTALNVAWYSARIAELTPAVLLASGVARDGFRIFISYRRKDSQALADQLFHALTDRGFSVFLDRASVPVGARFQRFLTEQLEDKSMVLVLETPRFEAKWTQYEIAFARRRRLGVFSLYIPKMCLPDDAAQGVASRLRKTESAAPLRSIDSGLRREMKPEEFVRKLVLPTERSVLSKAALKSVVEEVQRRHHTAYVRRRELILMELNAALREENLGPCTRGAGGAYIVSNPSTTAPQDWKQIKFLVTPRPADLSHLYEGVLGTPRHDPPGVYFVLVAPHLWANETRTSHLAWVRRFHRVEQVDPLHLSLYAQRLAAK